MPPIFIPMCICTKPYVLYSLYVPYISCILCICLVYPFSARDCVYMYIDYTLYPFCVTICLVSLMYVLYEPINDTLVYICLRFFALHPLYVTHLFKPCISVRSYGYGFMHMDYVCDHMPYIPSACPVCASNIFPCL